MPFITKEQTERDLILGTLSDIQDSIRDLAEQIEVMTDELDAKKRRLAAWKKKLEVIDAARPAGRRPKGANLKAISACLADAGDGLSASDVRTKTGLAWSSVQRVLTQHPDLFVEVNGLWRLRQRTPKVPPAPKTTAVLTRRAKSAPIVDAGDDEADDSMEPWESATDDDPGWPEPDLEDELDEEEEDAGR